MAILAALGKTSAKVFRRPRVAIFSTGSELVARGQPLPPGCIYDANGPMLEAAVLELGCQPVPLGIVPDDFEAILSVLERALQAADVVLLSGGTSKGLGDLSYRAVAMLVSTWDHRTWHSGQAGQAALSGRSTRTRRWSSCRVFHFRRRLLFRNLCAPLLARLAGRRVPPLRQCVVKVVSSPSPPEPGRREYIPARVFPVGKDLAAWPISKGSGSVSAFNQADGYLVVETLEEIVPAGAELHAVWILRSHGAAGSDDYRQPLCGCRLSGGQVAPTGTAGQDPGSGPDSRSSSGCAKGMVDSGRDSPFGPTKPASIINRFWTPDLGAGIPDTAGCRASSFVKRIQGSAGDGLQTILTLSWRIPVAGW